MKGHKKIRHIRTSKRGRKFWAGRGRKIKRGFMPGTPFPPSPLSKIPAIAEIKKLDPSSSAKLELYLDAERSNPKSKFDLKRIDTALDRLRALETKREYAFLEKGEKLMETGKGEFAPVPGFIPKHRMPKILSESRPLSKEYMTWSGKQRKSPETIEKADINLIKQKFREGKVVDFDPLEVKDGSDTTTVGAFFKYKDEGDLWERYIPVEDWTKYGVMPKKSRHGPVQHKTPKKLAPITLSKMLK